MTWDKEAAREYNREWHRAHPDYGPKQRRAWHDAHPEYNKERSKKLIAKRKARGLCTKCGGQRETPEYVTCGTCRQKSAAYLRSLRAVNPEPYREWVRNNREKIRESSRKFGRMHPEVIRMKNHDRRALKRGNGGRYTEVEIKLLFEKQEGKCFYCGDLIYSSFDKELHVDHKVPLSRGGVNSIENIALACSKCNLRKYDKTAEEFLVEREAACK